MVLAENKNQPAPTWVRRLIRELKKSDVEIKQVVGRYVWAFNLVKKQDHLRGLVERFAHGRRRHPVGPFAIVIKQLLSKRTRQFSRFNLMLADVVDYSPTHYATA